MFVTGLGDNDIYNVLISKGANIDTKNVIGQSAQDIITEFKRNRKINRPSPLNIYITSSSCPVHSPLGESLSVSWHDIATIPPPSQFPLHARKSSEVISPNFIFSPNLTPVIPVNNVPQLFFSNPLTPTYITNPSEGFLFPNSFLNHGIDVSQSVFLISPDCKPANTKIIEKLPHTT